MDTEKISEIYRYLSLHSEKLKKADGAFIFCRADPLLARRVSELFNDGLIGYALFTGGIGKDSGALAKLGYPESLYQAGLLRWIHGVSDEKIIIETTATCGIENSKYGIKTIALLTNTADI